MGEKNGLTLVQFVRPLPGYAAGERAAYSHDMARRLISQGFAVPVAAGADPPPPEPPRITKPARPPVRK